MKRVLLVAFVLVAACNQAPHKPTYKEQMEAQMGLTDEDKRRFAYEDQQREQRASDLHNEVCKNEPYRNDCN